MAAKVGTDGKVCLYTYSADRHRRRPAGLGPDGVDLRAHRSRASARDPRQREGQINYSAARPVAGQTVEVKVIGFGTTKVPADAGTVLLNVTAVDPSATPASSRCSRAARPRPLASNINLTGITVPNLVSAKVGDGGRVCIYTSGATDLIADILGYYPGTVLVG